MREQGLIRPASSRSRVLPPQVFNDLQGEPARPGLPVNELVLVAARQQAGELFTARERAALVWAEVVTHIADTGAPDTDYQAASAEFNGKELPDLTLRDWADERLPRHTCCGRRCSTESLIVMAWLSLVITGFLEIAFAMGMKSSDGFTRLGPSVFTVAAGLASVVLLSYSLRTLPAGTGYAAWTGIGAAGTAVLGMVLLGDSTAPLRILCLALILARVIGLKVISGS